MREEGDYGIIYGKTWQVVRWLPEDDAEYEVVGRAKTRAEALRRLQILKAYEQKQAKA
jgi:hypothetical protein